MTYNASIINQNYSQLLSRIIKPSVITGLSLIVLVTVTELFVFPSLLNEVSESEVVSFVLSFHLWTTILFMIGWILVGAGLKSRGSTRRGIGVAILIYLAVGVIIFLLRAKAFTDPLSFLGLIVYVPVTLVYHALTWPDIVFADLRSFLLNSPTVITF